MTAQAHYREALLGSDQDFSAAFVTINGIRDALRGRGEVCLETVFAACRRILDAPAYQRQKQAYFLYQSVAATLQTLALAIPSADDASRRRALGLLGWGLQHRHAGLRRAMAEALGTLPLAVDRRPPSDPACEDPPAGLPPLCDPHWLAAQGIRLRNGWEWRGRSMLAATRAGETLVIKCLRKDEDPASLCREAAWMRYIGRLAATWKCRFDVPRPLGSGSGCLVRLPDGMPEPPDGTMPHSRRYALAFKASAAYFHYPNEDGKARRLDGGQIGDVLGRNAWLMGRLMAMGIAHTAPIPLFHNRAQRHRREDGGRYRWTHAGRLDRWLASCRHPNFGVGGLRDFEHFSVSAGKPRERFEVIGSHLISLLLVAGSYFRQKDPRRVGCDPCGRPVDARDLFDRELLKSLIDAIWRGYYQGFTGRAASGEALAADALADRMIEEMGVDRHMEEILRVVDQEAMTRADFEAFLQSRGIPAGVAAGMAQGREDIPLITGPHLGGFNQAISLPELIHFAAAGAAHCVGERFRLETAGGCQGADRVDPRRLPVPPSP